MVASILGAHPPDGLVLGLESVGVLVRELGLPDAAEAGDRLREDGPRRRCAKVVACRVVSRSSRPVKWRLLRGLDVPELGGARGQPAGPREPAVDRRRRREKVTKLDAGFGSGSGDASSLNSLAIRDADTEASSQSLQVDVGESARSNPVGIAGLALRIGTTRRRPPVASRILSETSPPTLAPHQV
jgi:hypothetical protein